MLDAQLPMDAHAPIDAPTPGDACVTRGSDDGCDGCDDDCDGTVDEGYVEVATSCGMGACSAAGMLRCIAGHVEDSCTEGPPAATDDTCDGIDDDCDGIDDNGCRPLHQWTFNDGTANDSIGDADDTLSGGAVVTDGELVLDGIEAPAGDDVFDAIIFGEHVPGQWLAGSNYSSRTPFDNGGAIETSTELTMLAAVYDDTDHVTVYRSGVVYAGPYSVGPMAMYPAGDSDILIGLRHEDRIAESTFATAAGTDAYFAGAVTDARIYGQALSATQIAQLFAAGPAL